MSASELEGILRRVRSTGDLVEPARSTRRQGGAGRRSEAVTRNRNDWNRRALDARPAGLSIPDIRAPEPAHRPARLARPGEAWDNEADHAEEPPRNDASRRNTRPPPRGWLGKLMVFLGQAGPNARARSQLISLVWTLSSGTVQFVVIVALLAYATHHRSPRHPNLSEWDACQRPLGAWNAIWVVREGFTCILAYWQWSRERQVRLIQERRRTADTEAVAGSNEPSPAEPLEQFDFNFGNPTRPTYPAHHPSHPSNRNRQQPTTQQLLSQLPSTPMYNRLSMITSAMTLVWFLTAHILEYTSVNTCRFDAPHLWWLTFGILCILYLMILEIFLLGLLVFILGPVIFLFWNIFLLCLGRHPLQNPHHIRPDIGKLSKTVVDQIPLVLYIPPPPEENDEKDNLDAKSPSSPITLPSPTYSYPPKKEGQSAVRKRRFAFLRRFKSSKKGDSEKQDASGKGESRNAALDEEPKTWEDHWVPGDYPFVRLEDNRAACAICLMDFEEPEKKTAKTAIGATAATTGTGPEEGSSAPQEVQEVQVEEMTPEEAGRLNLQDAGEGAQPLRLLSCGHVFHVSILGLEDSARCADFYLRAENLPRSMADGRVRALSCMPARGRNLRSREEIEEGATDS
ncbi:hypothetical protein EIP86_003434 [Pleurotus ostreatoroseus]|nr:hypothetical protein EIP86_003434 [Pleurotus ostreatoroseus]